MQTRLSIDITQEEKQKIKAMAALSGVSVKDYILRQTIGGDESEDDWQELKKLLKPRLAAADREEYSKLTFDEIIAKAKRRKS